MRRNAIIFVISLIVMASCLACTKESRELMYAKQEESIDGFVKKMLEEDDSYAVTYNGGSVRVTLRKGRGEELSPRGSVTFTYAGYDFSRTSIGSSSLFATNSEDIASAAKWNITDTSMFRPVTRNLATDKILVGLKNGLEGVQEGEDCYIFFSGKYAFGKEIIGTIPANAPLAFRVMVEAIEN